MRDRVKQLPPEFQQFFDSPQQQQPRTQESQGSGFIVTKDGYILTNNHVVDGADQVTVELLDHRSFKAKIIGHDPQTDVAVLKIDAGDLPTIPLGDDSKTRVGEWALAIGNPFGLNFTVTAGIIKREGRAPVPTHVAERRPVPHSGFHPDRRRDQPRQLRWSAREHPR